MFLRHRHHILRYNPTTGKTITFRELSGLSNGLKFDVKWRLIVCEGVNTGGNHGMAETAEGRIAAIAGKGPTAGIHFFNPSGKRSGSYRRPRCRATVASPAAGRRCFTSPPASHSTVPN